MAAPPGPEVLNGLEFLDCRASVYAADPLIVGPRSAATPERKARAGRNRASAMRKSRLVATARWMSELSSRSLKVFHHSTIETAALVVPPSWASLQLAGVWVFGG